MNDEIKIGEYIETKGGHIRKVKEIEKFNEDYIYVLDEEVSNCNYIFKDYIKDHNQNIIDLIEVGDYVNGKIVKRIGDYETFKRIDFEEYEDYIYADDIKTIVTKEQMEKIMYRVEG